MTESARGLFSEGQREYLKAGAEFSNYKKRSDLRKHIHAGLVDGDLLFGALPEKDRRMIFEPDSNPTVDNDESELMEDTKENRVNRGVGRTLETHKLEKGIEGLIAFAYEGLLKHTHRRQQHTERTERYSRPFASVLQAAMHRVAERNGWRLEEFEFNVAFDKSETEGLLKKFNDGEATEDEAITLLQRELISSEQFKEYLETVR